MNFEGLRQVVGNPFYCTKDVQIYCTDCLTGMTQIPDDLISLTITSPP